MIRKCRPWQRLKSLFSKTEFLGKRNGYSFYYCQKTKMTRVTQFLRCVRGQAVMKRRSLGRIYLVCISGLPPKMAGALKSWKCLKQALAVIRKPRRLFLVRMYLHALNLNLVCIGYNASQKPRLVAAFIPLPRPLPCFPKPKKWTLMLMRMICGLTCFAPLARGGNR